VSLKVGWFGQMLQLSKAAAIWDDFSATSKEIKEATIEAKSE
jgi:hypothetical protein